MKHFSAETMINDTKTIGNLGEDIACRYLTNKGYTIVGRNYLKKWGEIDIICSTKSKLSFVEVKTVTREIKAGKDQGDYRPEENMHPRKLERFGRVIQSYLAEKYPRVDPDWGIMGLTVTLNIETKTADVRLIDNL